MRRARLRRYLAVVLLATVSFVAGRLGLGSAHRWQAAHVEELEDQKGFPLPVPAAGGAVPADAADAAPRRQLGLQGDEGGAAEAPIARAVRAGTAGRVDALLWSPVHDELSAASAEPPAPMVLANE